MDQLPTLDVELAFGVSFARSENLNVFCPFHEDPHSSNTKSCSVSRMGLFKCQVCQAKGTASKFFARVHAIPEDIAEEILSGKMTLAEAIKSGARGDTGVHHHMPGASASASYSTNGICDVHRDLSTRPSPPMAARATPNVKGFPPNIIQRTMDNLRSPSNKHWWDYLRYERGLTEETLDNYEIGCDEWRITIPIRDPLAELINIRRYLPTAKAKAMGVPKMVSHTCGVGSPVLYPAYHLWYLKPGDEIVICEGEWDAILFTQMFHLAGLPCRAVTNTGGVNVWASEWTRALCPYRCTLLYDVNDRMSPPIPYNFGQVRAQEVEKEFLQHLGCAGVRVVALPLPEKYDGGDITNWFVDEHRTAEELQKIMDEVPYRTNIQHDAKQG